MLAYMLAYMVPYEGVQIKLKLYFPLGNGAESPPLIDWLRQVIAELAPAKAKPVAMTELVSQSIGCRS